MENKSKGFVVIYRSIIDWEWYTDIPVYRLFTHMLYRANHKAKSWKGKEIDRGSFVGGRKKLSEETGLSEQEIRTAIKKLKSTGEITTKPTNKNTLYSIVNYDNYQTKDTVINQLPNQRATNEQPTSNQPSTNHQPLTTSKQGNNVTIDYMSMMKQWNNECDLGKIKSLSDARKKSINARIKEHGTNFLSDIIPIINNSSFLKGETSKWKANFDWCLKPTNYLKIVEGNYTNGEDSNKKKVLSDLLDKHGRKYNNAMAEFPEGFFVSRPDWIDYCGMTEKDFERVMI